MTGAQIIVLATPVFLLLIALEFWVGHLRGRNTYRLNDTLNSIGLGVMSQVTGVFGRLLRIGLYTLAFEHLALFRLPSDALWVWLFALVFYDFCYYWLHRAGHRVRWFWNNHAVHHSTNELNLGASLRIGAFGRLIGVSVFLLPMVWIGFDLRTVLGALTLNLLFQFWIHATWIPKLGWLEGWLNTPSAHRVHHAANLEYLDGNYGGVLVVFDRLFGTYIPERDDLPCRYGLVKPMTSYNPLVVEFAQWGALLRDLASARSPRAVLGYLFMPPGWAPDGPGTTTEALRAAQGIARPGRAGVAKARDAGAAGPAT
jgi:sterol desaturase/sphingolipid hydroxylase (fatty acid hydroxylase superfamily)